MDRLLGFLVMALAVAVVLPTLASAAHAVIPAIVMAIVGLVAIRAVL